MKSTDKLVEIILDVLDVKQENRPVLVNGNSRTIYNPTLNTIFLAINSLPDAFVHLAHESMHYLQHSENRLGNYTNEDRANYKGKTEGMFYTYEFEREAQAFGWLLAGKLVELLYSKKPSIKTAYEHNKKLYIKMMQLVESDVTSKEELIRIQELLDLEFTRIKEKYSERVDEFASQFIYWNQ